MVIRDNGIKLINSFYRSWQPWIQNAQSVRGLSDCLGVGVLRISPTWLASRVGEVRLVVHPPRAL